MESFSVCTRLQSMPSAVPVLQVFWFLFKSELLKTSCNHNFGTDYSKVSGFMLFADALKVIKMPEQKKENRPFLSLRIP